MDIAIDYTASNNENPISLHNISVVIQNDHEKAIISFWRIIAPYDFDKLFSVYGFGGIPHGPGNQSNSVCHYFNISFKDDPNIEGINNME